VLNPLRPTSRPTRPSPRDIVTGTTASTFIALMRSPTDRAACHAGGTPADSRPPAAVRQRRASPEIAPDAPRSTSACSTLAVSVDARAEDRRSDTCRRPPCATPRDRCEFLPELRDHVQQGPLRLMGVSLRG
jgi:hypothetical protein